MKTLWGSLPDRKVNLLLKKLLVDCLYETPTKIKNTFERRSGHRVEAYFVPVQSCAMNLRFSASWVRKDAPLKDVLHYEKIGGKDTAIGIVGMQPNGAVLLQLGEAVAILWNEKGRWLTITDDDLDGTEVTSDAK